MENLKKKKNVFIWVLAGIGIVVAAAVLIALFVKGSGHGLQEQLDLGRKYMSEMEYENAIVAYEAAIAIDPKCEEAYMELAEVYVAMGDTLKALEVLEEGYSQTESRSMLAAMEELGEEADKESDTGNGNQVSASNEETTDQDLTAFEESKERPEELFVQFVNAPSTDVNGFGDITDTLKGKEFAENHGAVQGEYELIPFGDLYFYGEIDFSYEDDYELRCIRVQDGEDVGAQGVSATCYDYVIDGTALQIETILRNLDEKTAENIPAIGGFAGFLAEHDCLSIEAIAELIGLGDEGIMEALAGVDTSYELRIDTPYGPADIRVGTYGWQDHTERDLAIVFADGNTAPFDYITILDSEKEMRHYYEYDETKESMVIRTETRDDHILQILAWKY